MEKTSSIMVLVTMQRMCARLIRKGADMALKKACPLKVVHVAAMNSLPANESAINAQVLDYLYALAGEAGAEMCVISSEVPVAAMADYAQENAVCQIVLGDGERAHGIAETLSELLPGVEIMIVEAE